MNPARIAALLRELAEAVEEDDAALHAARAPRPRAKRTRPTLVRPSGEAPASVAGQAARILRDREFR